MLLHVQPAIVLYPSVSMQANTHADKNNWVCQASEFNSTKGILIGHGYYSQMLMEYAYQITARIYPQMLKQGYPP